MRLRKYLIVLSAALLLGCALNPRAGYGIVPGMTQQAVIERMGAPQRTVRLPSGDRMQYLLGNYAWMVDLDASGKVVQARQTRTFIGFGAIEFGKWTREDVEREFGPPAIVDRVSSWSGPILTYWWADEGYAFYYIYLDERNVAQRAHPGMDYVNTRDGD